LWRFVYGDVVLCVVWVWLLGLPESYSSRTGGCCPFRVSNFRATILVEFDSYGLVPVRARLCTL